MNTVIRIIRDIIVAMLVAGLLLMNGQSATATQPVALEWFATELAGVLVAATRHDPVLMRKDRELTGPKNRDDGCHAYATRADQQRHSVVTSRLP
jgi:hypothetical protein